MTRRWIALSCLLAVLATACGPRGIQGTYPIPSDPPAVAPTPGWRALQEAYLVAADRAKRDYSQLFARQGLYRKTVQDLHFMCEGFKAIDVEFSESVKRIPWTAEYQEHVDAVLKKTDAIIRVLNQCIASKSIKNIKKYADKADLAYLSRQKASEQLRKDLHLSTEPMR
jgi:hypothetical protein